MKIKILFVALCSITFIGSIWIKNPSRQENIVLTTEANTGHNTAQIKPAFKNESYPPAVTLQKPYIYNPEIEKINRVSEDQKSKESHTHTTDIFTGNSNYTGDDTTDNDAGNIGFEDDFPEATFAYDDHAAEGYVNYTESYAD